MPNLTQTQQQAVRVLRRRVRYRHAHLRLPGTALGGRGDTAVIQKATRLYVETWIVPVLDALESGDTAALRSLTANCLGDPIS